MKRRGLLLLDNGSEHLVRFDAGAVEKPASSEPKWQLLFPLDVTRFRSDFPDGRITFSRDWLQKMLANWERAGQPRLAVDYFHRGQSDDSPVANDDKVASGWISKLRVSERGLEGLISWTDKARAHILADELAYLSPTFHPNAPDKQRGGRQGPTLFGAALLNDPFLTELPRVAASNAPKEKNMDKKQICAALGLPDDSTDDAIMACIKSMAAKMSEGDVETKKKLADAEKALTELREKATKSDAGVGEALRKLTEQITAQGDELKKLRAERSTDALVALQTKLESEGRILASEKAMVATFVEKLGIEEATKFTASWPVKVAVGERGISGGKDTGTPAEAKAKLDQLAADLVKNEKLSFSEARMQVLANPAHRPLVDLASKLERIHQPAN